MNEDAERRNLAVLIAALALGASLACESGSQTKAEDVSSLRARAAGDLKCAEERLVINQAEGEAKGVSGCGKRATYINRARRCEAGERPEADGRCTTWLLTSLNEPGAEGVTTAAPTATEPPKSP